MDDVTRTAFLGLAILAVGSLGCINLFDNEPNVPRPDLSGLECGDFEGSNPRLGYVWDDYEPLGSACPDLPVEPGFQGGFHITPAVWVPPPAQTGELTGVVDISVTFPNGESEPIETSQEIFQGFWQPVDGGSAAEWRIILPNDLVQDGGRWDVQVNIDMTFDDPEQAPISISESTSLYLDV